MQAAHCIFLNTSMLRNILSIYAHCRCVRFITGSIFRFLCRTKATSTTATNTKSKAPNHCSRRRVKNEHLSYWSWKCTLATNRHLHLHLLSGNLCALWIIFTKFPKIFFDIKCATNGLTRVESLHNYNEQPNRLKTIDLCNENSYFYRYIVMQEVLCFQKMDPSRFAQLGHKFSLVRDAHIWNTACIQFLNCAVTIRWILKSFGRLTIAKKFGFVLQEEMHSRICYSNQKNS